MFTGIIEEIGTVQSIIRQADDVKLTIKADKILSNAKIGDSICTNGVCLTITNMDGHSFTADVMHETVTRTNLKDLKVNSKVNLERAMPADGRFDGHIVSGHIDGTGIIRKKFADGKAIRIEISSSENILSGIVEKGSVAIDGISLTVTFADSEKFGVSVIRHTQSQTTLTSKDIGETVNIETDIIGKYVIKMFNFAQNEKKDSGRLLDMLKENNF